MATGGRRNHWVADKNALVTWQAELTHLREEPEALARWLRAIVRAGEDNEVYVVQEAPYLGYRRREHGEFLPFLESYMEREGVIDLFDAFTSGLDSPRGEFRATARLCYYDRTGTLVEGDLHDLGSLLAELRPEDELQSGSAMSRMGGLHIWGLTLDLAGRKPLPRWIDIHFQLLSDIWFPWVLGRLEEERDVDLWYENRELASRHTPRLNRFLAAVAEATEAVGGSFALDEEGLLKDMVDDRGVLLDVAPPGSIVPEPPDPIVAEA